MVRNGKMMVLGMSAITGMLAVWSSLAGCQSGTSTSTSGGGGGEGGGEGSSTTSGNTGGASTGSETTGATSTGVGGGGAVIAKIHDLTGDPKSTNKVGPGIDVKLPGVVAMSRKFLISKSGSGSCLWGVFVSENIPTAKPYTGILVVDYGDNASASMPGGMSYCPVATPASPAGGRIPDDVVPGDVLDIIGIVTSYAPTPDPKKNACVAGMAKQLQFSTSGAGGTVSRTTIAGPIPAPYDITDAELKLLAPHGLSQAFYSMMGGVKIRLKNVQAGPLPAPIIATGAVGDHGEIYLAGSGLRVARKVYYQGLLASQSDICRANPVYSDPATMFTSIEGLTMLDFCDWAIAPGNRCNDIAPPSSDCTGKVCAP